jgi:DNA-binding transcriptional LysR family regulator
MQEQHVSAAAKRLHLTQPAISNSLQQLRELFKDELLIRGPKKMVPTQKALLLTPQVEQVLRQLETIIFYTGEFEYKISERTFKLGMSDYSEYVLLPKLYEYIKKIAPDVALKIIAYNNFTPDDFESGHIELGISLAKKFPRQLKSEKLFSDQVVCVTRAKHPIFKSSLTLENPSRASCCVCFF